MLLFTNVAYWVVIRGFLPSFSALPVLLVVGAFPTISACKLLLVAGGF